MQSEYFCEQHAYKQLIPVQLKIKNQNLLHVSKYRASLNIFCTIKKYDDSFVSGKKQIKINKIASIEFG